MVNQETKVYDLIIIGAGAAGLTASVYASRYKINHLVLGEVPGGQGLLAPWVENYPGFPGITGPELMQKFLAHAKEYEAEIRQEKVAELHLPQVTPAGRLFTVITDKDEYQTKTLILAMGASYKTLGVLGEKELLGKGVSYCTNCDAPFFKGKTVAIVGGGNAAVIGAMHLSSFAEKVYLIHRRDEFRAEPYKVEQMRQNPKIEPILSTQVQQILGTEKVEGIVLDQPFKGSTQLALDGIFIEIGHIPSSVLAAQLEIQVDAQGYIHIDSLMRTSVPGVYAAGDLAAENGEILLRQFVTAVADGAKAAASAFKYLHEEVKNKDAVSCVEEKKQPVTKAEEHIPLTVG